MCHGRDPPAILVHVANEAVRLAPLLPLLEAVGSLVTRLAVFESGLEPVQLPFRHLPGSDFALGLLICTYDVNKK